jgi:hypothetical protein
MLAVGYPIVGSSILPLRLTAEDYLVWLETAVKAARYINNPASEAAALGAIGSVYIRRGERDQAVNVLEQSFRLG